MLNSYIKSVEIRTMFLAPYFPDAPTPLHATMTRAELRDVEVATQVKVKMGKVMGSFWEGGLSLCEAIIGRSHLSNILCREGRQPISISLIIITKAAIFAKSIDEWYAKDDMEKTWIRFQVHFRKL